MFMEESLITQSTNSSDKGQVNKQVVLIHTAIYYDWPFTHNKPPKGNLLDFQSGSLPDNAFALIPVPPPLPLRQ